MAKGIQEMRASSQLEAGCETPVARGPLAEESGEPERYTGVNKKRLACTNCRRRRKKCDLNYPCSSCLRLKLECNVNDEDLRKKRYSITYVKNLETQVAFLESKMRELADSVPLRDRGLRGESLGEQHFRNLASTTDALQNQYPCHQIPRGTRSAISGEKEYTSSQCQLQLTSMKPDMEFERPLSSTSQSSASRSSGSQSSSSADDNDILRRRKFVKGSIYPDRPMGYQPKNTQTEKELGSAQRICDLRTAVILRTKDRASSMLNSDPKILKSLSNFYTWLYPGHFIFLHRESFLYGFFNNSDSYESSRYCSEELIYAMAAVGSRLSTELHAESEQYAQIAKDRLLRIVFDEQSPAKITTVQALLCLAFYELGNGNNQLAWSFSGLAIRVGHDIGFQLDPKVWVTDEDSSALSESELEIRSRIYWGCYIADHLICLLLGRTPTLSVSNSTIPESDELPEIDGTEDFRFDSNCVLQISLPLKNLIILSRIIQIFTAKIFIEPSNTSQRIEYLVKFNLKVYHWRQSLPDFLKWSQARINDPDVSTDPTISYFWYHYYIVLLTFNRPFMDACTEAKAVVLEALADLRTLLSIFRWRFSLSKASIYHLYSCLLAIDCADALVMLLPDPLITTALPDPAAESSFFRRVLQDLAPAYDLPRRFAAPPTDPLRHHLASLHVPHDFSLSDEIDDLIRQVFGFDRNLQPAHHL
ncbi:AaceriADR365Wp [[Ashbya] aceris (nom. inval.)]|nr:AaceriADR365Wp [[Ashbya] aceris (nom. inval.)]